MYYYILCLFRIVTAPTIEMGVYDLVLIWDSALSRRHANLDSIFEASPLPSVFISMPCPRCASARGDHFILNIVRLHGVLFTGEMQEVQDQELSGRGNKVQRKPLVRLSKADSAAV